MPRSAPTSTNPSGADAAHRAHRDANLPGHLDHGRMRKLLGYNLAQAAIPSFKIF